MNTQRGSQRGAIEMLAVGGIAIALMAAMVWVQQLRLNTAVAEKERVEIALTTANAQVTTLGEKNKQIDEVIATMKTLEIAARDESVKRQADIVDLKNSVTEITKKIPKVIPKPNEPPQSTDQIERSQRRAVAMQEAYCLSSPMAVVCLKEPSK